MFGIEDERESERSEKRRRLSEERDHEDEKEMLERSGCSMRMIPAEGSQQEQKSCQEPAVTVILEH